MPSQMEYQFTLPKGYLDEDGELHKTGYMRLATDADEMYAMRDPRAVQDPSYMMVVLLSRVVVRLGYLPMVTTQVIERLSAADFSYLSEFYNMINSENSTGILVTCPNCQHRFTYNTAAGDNVPGQMNTTLKIKDVREVVKGLPLNISRTNGVHIQEIGESKKDK